MSKLCNIPINTESNHPLRLTVYNSEFSSPALSWGLPETVVAGRLWDGASPVTCHRLQVIPCACQLGLPYHSYSVLVMDCQETFSVTFLSTFSLWACAHEWAEGPTPSVPSPHMGLSDGTGWTDPPSWLLAGITSGLERKFPKVDVNPRSNEVRAVDSLNILFFFGSLFLEAGIYHSFVVLK